MKDKTGYASIGLIVLGMMGVIYNAHYTNQNSYVAEDGSLILVESLGLPLGSLMIFVGLLILIALGVRSLVKKR